MLIIVTLLVALVDARWHNENHKALNSPKHFASQNANLSQVESIISKPENLTKINKGIAAVQETGKAADIDDDWKDRILQDGEDALREREEERRIQSGGGVYGEDIDSEEVEVSSAAGAGATEKSGIQSNDYMHEDPVSEAVPAGSSGPFGVSIGNWILIGFIALAVVIAFFLIRAYIRPILGCLETSCYWSLKALAYPFTVLYRIVTAIAYPAKEFCHKTYQSYDEYVHPWSVVH
mmetsp:Transcript_10917/g.15160  ORF Transcript_10917/g.15160 Transcript_10917/m.15160 type:complete len:236 (+) Transcript_10917:142-849(+)|eukprot:CAMPEP_0184487282 /NCGR_PEP_ID=MMETSP0113_2-20130426/9682_1 /TAXON_ID=91329 /ORGANISM="Norrisiella sphaerica, Strain BC52" /LENGTH=235 /DNA_ID=CAMNT_0026869527 /DNA_START=142 /DNA_END=849 /DNA_ORIENTATION=+